MRIAQTRFRNFRNLENSLVEWGNGINLLTGVNGSGKTNALEALHILTGWGRFSGAKFVDVVKWDSSGGSFLAAKMEGEKEAVVQVNIVPKRSLRLDGQACRWGDLRGCVQSLSFLPSDMALIEGSPEVRRKFLDVICALYFPLYAYKLSEYKKITMHRRYLLKLGHSVRITQETMAKLAAWVWSCREEIVKLLRANLALWCDLLPQELSVELRRGGAGNCEDPLEDFHRSSELLAEKERMLASPLVGPHRDELVLTSNSRAAFEAFSRGQRRRAALSLVMAAASTVQRRYKMSPVLILDEVTSELDAAGRSILFECLKRSGWQTFATTAESVLPNFEGTKWNLSCGSLKKL